MNSTPLGELVGAVVGDLIRRGVEVRAVEPDDRDLFGAHLPGCFEARVTGDHLTGAFGDDGLLPPEALE